MNFFSSLAGMFFDALSEKGTGKRRTKYGNNADSKRVVTRYTRTAAMRLARWAYANEGYTRGAVDTMARYSHGIHTAAASADEEWNDASDAWWQDAKDILDISGQATWRELLWHASVSIDVDGDAGFILLKNDWPQIQNIRGHRIGASFTYDSLDAPNFYDGVTTASTGSNRPVSYRVITDDFGLEFIDVPADSFVFVGERRAADEVRCISNLIHALNSIQDLHEIIALEKEGVRTAISPGLVHTAIDPSDRLADTYVDANGIEREQLFGGMIVRIKQGEKIEGFETNRPTPGLNVFADVLIKPISLGLGLPTSIVWNPESINGAPTRLAVNMAQRRFEQRQNVLARIERRVRGWATCKAMKLGDLPWNDEWYRHKLVRPASMTVDYGREANANLADIAGGVRTLEEDAGERGLDWEHVREQSEKENLDLVTRAQNIADTTGIPFETALLLMRSITPNGNPQPPAQPAPAPANGRQNTPTR